MNYTYTYNHQFQTLTQQGEDGKILLSMHIPHDDLRKVEAKIYKAMLDVIGKGLDNDESKVYNNNLSK